MDTEFNCILLKEILPFLKELILLIFGAIGSYVAIQGLNTWKRQLKGKDEYELCKKVLVDLYKYKNGINIVRNPIMFEYEYENNNSDFDDKKQKYKNISNAYQRRWDNVQENNDKLKLSIMESKVYWDDELEKLFIPLFVFENKLFNSVQEHLLLHNPNIDEDYRHTIGKNFNQKNKDEILYFLGNKDKYNLELEKNIKRIENFIRTKLKK